MPEETVSQPVNYEAVLADLERRRATLDLMIEMVKQFIKTNQSALPQEQPTLFFGTNPMPPTKPQVETSDEIPNDAFFGMKIPDAIRKYLGIIKRKQSVRQIADALEHGGIQHTSESFYRTVNATLHRLWKDNGDPVQVGKEWGLAAWYPGRRIEKRAKDDSE